MKSIVEYVEDRYKSAVESPELAAYEYVIWLKDNGFKMLDRAYGFITYKFEGDACIIHDIYTTREFRKSKYAWALWQQMLETIQAKPECKVVIGFSENIGENHKDGIGAMLAAGFVEAYKTKEQTIYMRGTQ